MYLTPELVASFKTAIENPTEHGFAFKPFKDYWLSSDVVTAKHILADEYMKIVNIPKLVLYIIMDEVFGQCRDKDKDGLLGYKLAFKP
jgi:hypothetical protein